MATLARNEKRESLRYSYTPAERGELGQQLAEAHIRLDQITEEEDRVKADFKSRKSTIENEKSLLATQVSTGYAMREYVCFYEYDSPERGRKTLRRKEPPCDVVRVEEMSEADRQTVMESIEAQVTGEPGHPDNPVGAIVPYVPQPPRQVTPSAASAEDEDLTWAAALEEQRKANAKEAAEKLAAGKGKGRRTSTGGVVATEADGKDLTDPDDNKAAN